MKTILVDPEEKRKFHLKLAEFFVDHCKDIDRVIFMAPEQLKLSGQKKRLLEFLRKDERAMNRTGFWKLNYYKVISILNSGRDLYHYFKLKFNLSFLLLFDQLFALLVIFSPLTICKVTILQILSKTLNFTVPPLAQVYRWLPREFTAGGNPAMDWHPIQGE